MTKTPPRLFVLMRPDCDRAVVFRQGPSKVFCVLGWNLKTDDVVVGQWCKHKIYVERCDISANGKYLVYFALDGQWSSEARGAWTALSYAPYLKALKLWPQGHTWGGGGMFVRERKPVPAKLASAFQYLDELDGEHIASVSDPYDRLIRDGWTRVKGGARKTLTKSLALQHALVGTRSKFALVDGDRVSPRPAWTFADVDAPRKRLVWAEGGALYQARIKASGLAAPDMIYDARDMTFEAIAAPYRNKTVIVGA
jgi:hypothetical protein